MVGENNLVERTNINERTSEKAQKNAAAKL